jgi:hypothetical protein
MKCKAARAERIIMILVGFVLLLGVVVPIGLVIWQAVSPSVVVVRGNAGKFISATSSQGGFFSPTLTSVQTNEGTVTVTGAFSALRGNTLVVERMNKSAELSLCIVGAHGICAPLAGAWSGVLNPVPQSTGITDFSRHGLARANLWTWIGLGLVATVLTFIISTVAFGRAGYFGEEKTEGE